MISTNWTVFYWIFVEARNQYKLITETKITYDKQITEANIIFSKCKLLQSNSGKTSDLFAFNSSFCFTCKTSTGVSPANWLAAGYWTGEKFSKVIDLLSRLMWILLPLCRRLAMICRCSASPSRYRHRRMRHVCHSHSRWTCRICCTPPCSTSSLVSDVGPGGCFSFWRWFLLYLHHFSIYSFTTCPSCFLVKISAAQVGCVPTTAFLEKKSV